MADPFKIFDDLVAESDGRPAGSPGARRRSSGTGGSGTGSGWRRFLAWTGAAVVAVALPFAVLLRTSTGVYRAGLLGTWPALGAGALATFILLAVYVAVASHRLGGGFRVSRRVLQVTALVVGAYCLYGVVFLAGANAKSESVRAEYRSLHPILRLAVGTLVLADGTVLVTDASRTREDYGAMGLPVYEGSLHRIRETGYAHALDLRTNGRSGIRNGLTRLYFAVLGFRTLRHGGTGDHLHVSLPLPPG